MIISRRYFHIIACEQVNCKESVFLLIQYVNSTKVNIWMGILLINCKKTQKEVTFLIYVLNFI